MRVTVIEIDMRENSKFFKIVDENRVWDIF